MLEYIKTHWAEIGVIVLTLHTLLKAIARMTKTSKDDEFLEKISKVIGYLFGKDPNA